MKLSNKTQIILIFALSAALISVGVVYAVYISTSNHVTGTPSTPTTTLTPSTTAPVSGVDWTLTVHFAQNTANLPVTLYNNAVQVATGTTDASGNAVFTVAPTATFDYYATVLVS